MVEKEEEEENEVLCEPDGPEEDAKGNEDDFEGQSYVVRKLMLTHKQEENTQHHHLFRTRRTINHDKLFELIIDSGSFENIISREAVKELKLQVEKHRHPNTIGWIKTIEKIEVNEHCKVSFSIGKYRDEVYCDVVDMDTCQLLFARPWQFD